MKKEVKEGIVISIVVILFLLVVYLITALFTTGELGKSKDSETTTASSEVTELYSNMILANNVFDRNEDSYMVILLSDDDAKDTIKNSVKSYSGEKKLYVVNLDEKINNYVVSKEENKAASNPSELKINKTTLLMIDNHAISSYVTDTSEILAKMK